MGINGRGDGDVGRYGGVEINRLSPRELLHWQAETPQGPSADCDHTRVAVSSRPSLNRRGSGSATWSRPQRSGPT